MERYRRGKAHRAKTGSVNVLSGAPFGYRYLRKTPHARAGYEIVAHEAVLVRGGVPPLHRRRRLDRRPGPLADRPGRTHPHRQDPLGPHAWSGPCCATPPTPGRPSSARPRPSAGPPASTGSPARPGASPAARSRPSTGPAEEWVHIPVPAIISRRDLRRGPRSGWPTTSGSPPATPRSPPCCRAWPPARAADTPTTAPHPHQPDKKIYYYRCLGSDDYRYRARAGLRQQAGPRRLPRPGRLGPHHRPARRPRPDPRRDRPSA